VRWLPGFRTPRSGDLGLTRCLPLRFGDLPDAALLSLLNQFLSRKPREGGRNQVVGVVPTLPLQEVGYVVDVSLSAKVVAQGFKNRPLARLELPLFVLGCPTKRPSSTCWIKLPNQHLKRLKLRDDSGLFSLEVSHPRFQLLPVLTQLSQPGPKLNGRCRQFHAQDITGYSYPESTCDFQELWSGLFGAGASPAPIRKPTRGFLCKAW